MFGKSKIGLAVLALAVVALAIPALSLAGRNTTELEAKLKGKNEVPGPGDKNGKGDIHGPLKPKKEKVCFNLEVSKLDPLDRGAHPQGRRRCRRRHQGAAVRGPGRARRRRRLRGLHRGVKKKLIKKIAKAPEKFYANIHTEAYPDGAVRGQLEPSRVVEE